MVELFKYLPPEILRVVASYMEYEVLFELVMSSRHAAWFFAGVYFDLWRIGCCASCCRYPVDVSSRRHSIYICDFFEGLKRGTAPVYARRVTFEFCPRIPPVQRAYYPCDKSELDQIWTPENTKQLFELLNAKEITIAFTHELTTCFLRSHGTSYEYDFSRVLNTGKRPLIAALLRASVKEVPSAIVKFQVSRLTIKNGLCAGTHCMTVRDSSTSPSLARKNLYLALSELVTSKSANNHMWSELMLPGYGIPVACFSEPNIYPNVRYLTAFNECLAREHPDCVLVSFPRCQQFTVREPESYTFCPDLQNPGVTFYFNDVSEKSLDRHCTRIHGHTNFYSWTQKIINAEKTSAHVRMLEFHHAEYTMSYNVPYTPSVLLELLSILMKAYPNLEKMIFKFDADWFQDLARADFLLEGQTLRTDFCDHCVRNVHVIETDIKVVRSRLRSSTRSWSAMEKAWRNLELVTECTSIVATRTRLHT